MGFKAVTTVLAFGASVGFNVALAFKLWEKQERIKELEEELWLSSLKNKDYDNVDDIVWRKSVRVRALEEEVDHLKSLLRDGGSPGPTTVTSIGKSPRLKRGRVAIRPLLIFNVHDENIITPKILFRRHIIPAEHFNEERALKLTRGRERGPRPLRLNIVFCDPGCFMIVDCEIGDNVWVAAKAVETFQFTWKEKHNFSTSTNNQQGEWISESRGLTVPIFVQTSQNAFHLLRESLDFDCCSMP